MPFRTTALVIADFLGLYDDPTPFEIGDKQASKFQNLYSFRNKLYRRLGTRRLYTLPSASNVDMIQWGKVSPDRTNPNADRECLLVAQDGNLYDLFRSSNPISGGTGRYTSGSDVNSCWLDGVMYGCDGKNQIWRYNGLNIAQLLPDKPPTASGTTYLTIPAGAGNLKGDYSYLFVWLSADGFYSEVSNPTTGITVTNQKINLAGFPSVPAGQDITGLGIFRTKGNEAGTYYFVTGITSLPITNLVDNFPDTDLSIVWRPENTRTPPGRYLLPWNGRLAVAGCLTSDGDELHVYLTNVLEPQYSPLVPNEDFADTQGTREMFTDIGASRITGLVAHGAVLIVMMAGSMHMIEGDTVDELIGHPSIAHGCVAHRTLVSVKGGLIWLSPDGVYVWDGQSAVRISDDVREHINGMTADDMAKAHAIVWYNRYYLMWPNGALWYDLDTARWGELTNWNWRDSTLTIYTADALPRIYAAKAGSGQIFQLETGNTDNGTAITTLYTTKDWDMGIASQDKRAHYVGAKFRKATGTVTIRLYRGTGELIQTFTLDLSNASSSATMTKLFKRCVEQARSEHFRLEVECSTTDPNYEILALELHYTVA